VGVEQVRRSLVALFACALLASPAAWGQSDYPSKPVRIVVPFPPGGATDVVTRVIAQDWSKRFAHPVVVENRPGANGIVGTAASAKAAPDGYTLVMGGVNTHGMNDALYTDLPYRSDRDFAPISLTAKIGIVIVATPKLGIRSFAALLEEARAKPGALAYGSSGMGGPHHLAMELLKGAAQVDLTHVAYKGGAPQLQDLLGGQVPVGAIGLPPALPHLKSGALVPLAVTDKERSPLLPAVPTVAEAGIPGFEVVYWLALFAPAQTPFPIIDRLTRETHETLKSPQVAEQLAAQGAEVMTSQPAALGALVKTEITRWQKLVRERGIRAE
jgi:tripartite-type tricarboxylate transporter receptor subunit TctC